MQSLTPNADAVRAMISEANGKVPDDPYDRKVHEMSSGFLFPAMTYAAECQDAGDTGPANRAIADALTSVVVSLVQSQSNNPADALDLLREIVLQVLHDGGRAIREPNHPAVQILGSAEAFPPSDIGRA